MVLYYVFIIPFFIIISHQFLIPFSNAIPFVDDKMLVALVKGQQETQISEYSKQKYETHLRIIYFMRKNWHCDKIADEFEEYERTECQKYRKYLDILFEYLSREYFGIPTVKPKFVFKNKIEIEGTIIYAVNCLVKISEFYFINRIGQKYEYKLNKFYYDYDNFELKLLNEKKLNYESKLSINEMILQLAIDTANEWQINEINLDGIILKNCGEKFEEYLEEMYLIIFQSKFYNHLTWTDDALFSEFVKGLATKFRKFFRMVKEYSNYIIQKKENGTSHWYDKRMISYELYEIEKMNEFLTQKYEAHLGVMYLMRENWHCDKIGKEFEEKERKICQTNRKYLHILYEYLFRLYVEGTSNEMAHKLSAVKPMFMNRYRNYQTKLISIVQTLNFISNYFWPKDKNIFGTLDDWKMVLVNEIELNYEIKEEENWFSKFKQNVLEKNNAPKNIEKKGMKNLNLSNEIEDNLRQEFEQKMKKMYEKTKENAKEENSKVEKAIENVANNEERRALEYEYDDKFGTFILSSFS